MRRSSARWRVRAGSDALTFRYAEATYTAKVTAHTYAPSLAFITLENPAFDGRDPRSGKVAGDVPERRLSARQRQRFFAGRAFTPTFVPPGYGRWRAGELRDYDDFVVELAGGARGSVKPALRSSPVPDGWTPQQCDPTAPPAGDSRCVLWGTTAGGIKVYIGRLRSAPDGLDSDPVAIVDATLVTLEHGHNHPYVAPKLSREGALRIFDSLRAHNTPARR